MPIYMIIGLDPVDGDRVNWGYKCSYEEAEHIILNNITDIHENCYSYTVIEKIYPGIAPDGCVEWFFKWDKENKCYKPIGRTPEEYEHHTCFFM